MWFKCLFCLKTDAIRLILFVFPHISPNFVSTLSVFDPSFCITGVGKAAVWQYSATFVCGPSLWQDFWQLLYSVFSRHPIYLLQWRDPPGQQLKRRGSQRTARHSHIINILSNAVTGIFALMLVALIVLAQYQPESQLDFPVCTRTPWGGILSPYHVQNFWGH